MRRRDLLFQKVNVSVVFYDRFSHWKAKLLTVLGWTRLHHCGIIFTIGDNSILLMSDKTHRAKFIDAERFHDMYWKPCKILDLGIADVSIQQLTNYISVPYIGNARSLAMWYFITNGILKLEPLQPRTCALLVSNILRLCGYNVTDCVTPRRLHKELVKLCS